MNGWIFLVVPSISAIFVGATERMSYALGAVDLPRVRHRHAFPTARLGGVGFVLAFLLCILFFVPEKSNTVASLFLSLPLLLAAGVLDDIFTLTPPWKLLLQISASAAALTALDIRGGFSLLHLCT